MTVFDTTRRDLVLIKGYAFVPVQWSRVTVKDTILSRAGDGETRYVVKVENLGEHRVISVMHGEVRQTLTVRSNDPVHVLDHTTGARHEAHVGGDVVRQRKSAKRSD